MQFFSQRTRTTDRPRSRSAPHQSRPYLLFVLTLSLFALLSLAIDATVPLDEESRMILAYADTAVCVIFFLDFLVCLYMAPSRVRYFFTWGWLDLLASIPVVEPLRWGRAARLVRIVRVLRVVRSSRMISTMILDRRSQSGVLAVGLMSILLVFASSVAILQVERHADANITTGDDAVWWALTTITTVGYGDYYPVTFEGRCIAGVLMLGGVGLFGTLSGFLAAWFLQPEGDRENAEILHLREEIAELKRLVIESRASSSPPAAPGADG